MDSTGQYPYWDALRKMYETSSLLDDCRDGMYPHIWYTMESHIIRVLKNDSASTYCSRYYECELLLICSEAVREKALDIINADMGPTVTVSRIIKVLAAQIDGALSQIYTSPSEVKLTSPIVLWHYIHHPGKPYNTNYMVIPKYLYAWVMTRNIDLSLPLRDNAQVFQLDINKAMAVELYLKHSKGVLTFSDISPANDDGEINSLSSMLYDQ